MVWTKKIILCFALCTIYSAYAAQIRLDELEIENISTGWGEKVQAGKSIAGNAISIAGKKYEHGMGTHSVSKAVVKLDGRAETFTAWVGMDDEVMGESGNNGSVRFIVKADAQIRFDSGIMKPGDAAQKTEVDLKDCRVLSLEVSDAQDNNWSDHADWADAAITYEGTRPQIISADEQLALQNSLYYAAEDKRTPSAGQTAYYIDPKKGDDSANGKSKQRAWKTLSALNHLRLAPGDTVRLFPGDYPYSLHLSGSGTAANPITVRFSPGKYNFFSDQAIRRNYHFSNANDAPYRPKEVALCLENLSHYKIEGRGAMIVIHGRMVETVLDQCKDVTVTGLTYTYDRPTVSEFKPVAFGKNWVDIKINESSDYSIENGQLFWVERGDKRIAWEAVQIYDPASGYLYRDWDDHFSNIVKAVELKPGRVRLTCSSKPLIKSNVTYQTREWPRYYVGHFIRHSKNIVFKDIHVDFMHGLGFLNQFSENLTYDNVDIIPDKSSGRTCSAWCDALHFSGCRGKIRIKDCIFSGVNDDPINIHGTHLRITEKAASDQIKVRFMHPQTYGIDAFFAGDEIEFVENETLLSYGCNRVKAVQKLNDYELLLTLERPLPESIGEADAVENITWTPDVHISGCYVELDSTRGFLVTTRGKVVIEDCKFYKTSMAAILIANDAGTTANPENSWFESGPVRDVLIRNNKFIECAQPVIFIEPENDKHEGPVHKNVNIVDNKFVLSSLHPVAVSAKSTQNLLIKGNTFKTSGEVSSIEKIIRLNNCDGVTTESNKLQ